MFIKPFRVKSNTPIKGSDRKKVKAQLKQAFPNLSDDDLNAAVPAKEDVSVMKVETHCGEVVNVYCLGKKPVLIQVRDALYPTVYLLWTVPPGSWLPVFTTWPPVVAKLQKGADLMLPGVIVDAAAGRWAYGRSLARGAAVGVDTSANAAPVAVGRAALASDDLYMAAGRGKAVEILHCVGDKLWELGGARPAPELGPPQRFCTAPAPPPHADADADPSRPDLAVGVPVEGDHQETAGDGPPEPQPPAQVAKQPDATDSAPEAAVADDGDDGDGGDSPPVEEATPQQLMDQLVEFCFFKALKTTAKKVDLPVLTSNFFRLHMVPACPAGRSLDVKKSSHKKLSKFLESVQREGIVTVKELSKGVESITAVNYEHERVRHFRLPVSDAGGDPTTTSTTPAGDASDAGVKYTPPVITPLLLVNAATAALFAAGSFKKGASLRPTEVRAFLNDYVRSNQLQDPANPSQVRLDPLLSDVVLQKGENNVLAMAWEKLTGRVVDRLSPAFRLAFAGDADDVLVKGQLEPVDIATANRSGNKKVTLVTGLETFRIDLEQFARRCQVGVAASTTITSSAAKKGQTVLVQGNQTVFVGRLLVEEYGIPKQFVRGLDVKAMAKKTNAAAAAAAAAKAPKK